MADSQSNWNASAEFPEFTRKQIIHYQKMFKHYDSDRDKFLGVDDLAKMMKKIKSSPVELSGLDEMIREVDEDGDGKLSLREFILIFHKAQNSSLRHVGLIDIYRQMHLFDEEQEAVIPAISAFKAQIEEWSATEEGTMI